MIFIPEYKNQQDDFSHVIEYFFGYITSSLINSNGEHYKIVDCYSKYSPIKKINYNLIKLFYNYIANKIFKR